MRRSYKSVSHAKFPEHYEIKVSIFRSILLVQRHFLGDNPTSQRVTSGEKMSRAVKYISHSADGKKSVQFVRFNTGSNDQFTVKLAHLSYKQTDFVIF